MTKLSRDGTDPATWDPALDGVLAAQENHTVLYEDEAIRVISVSISPGAIGRSGRSRMRQAFSAVQSSGGRAAWRLPQDKGVRAAEPDRGRHPPGPRGIEHGGAVAPNVTEPRVGRALEDISYNTMCFQNCCNITHIG
jgi:hypothetical protein